MIIERDPTPDEYRHLRSIVGWNELDADAVSAGLTSALFSVVIERDGEAVGCGRVVGDGGIYFYVQDVIVVPELQGHGWGGRIMEAAKDVDPFYRRFGFERRPDDRPGMFRIR